ncbi:glycosyltransferase family 4 protein [Algibacter sp. Ld11]|uniref:glycosyltransferase family 4 protein n=1 Tax=Algibacter sp. Ld11 TaxID=649150 RepID=UPI00386303F0
MKITIITSPFGLLPPEGYGAVEKLWYDIAVELASQKHDLTIIAKKSKLHPTNTALNIKPVSGYERTKSIYLDLILDLIYSFKTLLKVDKSDILMLNTFWSPILMKLFFWKSKKVVYNVARAPKGHFKLYKNLDRFYCVSSAVVSLLEKELPHLKSKITCISNPVNTSCYQFNPPRKDDGIIKILYFGRIHPEKGLDILIKATQSLIKKEAPIELHLLGPYTTAQGGGGDKYKKKLNALAENFKIQWHPPVSDNLKLSEQLKKSDIFCYPSIAEKGETFGVAPLEAMAAGRATIVSNLECFKDFVVDNRNGLIFNHRQEHPEHALVEKLKLLIEDKTFRDNLAENGADTALGFSVQKISNLYLSDFQELLN